MAYTTIDDPSVYFQTTLYTGNGGTQSITNTGNSDLQPDWIWIKERNGTSDSAITDSVRGNTKIFTSNDKAAEGTSSDYITAFNSDGFSTGQNNQINESNKTHAAWQWKETADAGFDMVLYTGNDTARTISHSLSAVPKMMIIKCRNVGKEWTIFHASLGNGKFIELDQTTAVQTATNRWNDTSPTSSVFTVGVDSSVNADTQTYIAYLFSEKKGYSKFESYTGNGNADGTFVYTGFRPAWIMRKNTNGGVTESWIMQDNKRNTFNVADKWLEANASVAEDTAYQTDFLSNGFKMRSNNDGTNRSGTNYIYMAFAENPFVTSTGVPATAR